MADTLGARIRNAVAQWSYEGGVRGWGADESVAKWEQVLVLCALAEAADRLAEITDVFASEGYSLCGPDLTEYNEALVGYRAAKGAQS